MPLAALIALVPFLAAALKAAEPVKARHAMVVTEEPHATEIGVSVLKRGGNAVDAAVAVGFALAVTHPFAGNLGGGGFMLIRFADGRSTFVDFREQAPEGASRDMYLDAAGNPTLDSIDGWRASGVPGTVRGFELAQSKYGRRKWADLIVPAVKLARQGFPVPATMVRSLQAEEERLAKDPESKRIFLKNGTRFREGEKLLQPELAETLARIATGGAQEFYEGQTGQRLAAEMAAHGGLVTLADLQNYRAVERAPLAGKYRDVAILTAPPPSSGGIGLLEMLGMLEGSGYEKTGARSAATIHYMAEVMRRSFADRSQYLGDPDFVKVPVKGLLDPEYLKNRRATIDTARATPSAKLRAGLPPGIEPTETTHYSIVDAQGNAVAVTYTLNNGYGSAVAVPGLGFLLNDEMDDFTSKPGMPNLFGLIQGEANAIAPRKRPASAMTPTIATREGHLFLVLGSPGGPRIITAVLEAFLNVVDFGMNIQDAVNAPRFHHQWMPDKLYLEKEIAPEVAADLERRGHHIEYSPGVVLARVEAILTDEKGRKEGAADRRFSGKAAGY
ncbi:MAG TPA: gamma-glutamyltransferase [Bryobacteraceae bacterium]|nr:gamma-glutamyltransferase [Bryobacteraceae bacterium]